MNFSFIFAILIPKNDPIVSKALEILNDIYRTSEDDSYYEDEEYRR